MHWNARTDAHAHASPSLHHQVVINAPQRYTIYSHGNAHPHAHAPASPSTRAMLRCKPVSRRGAASSHRRGRPTRSALSRKLRSSIHAHTHTRAPTRTHAHARAYTHTHTHTHTRTHAHARTRTRARLHAHAHTHASPNMHHQEVIHAPRLYVSSSPCFDSVQANTTRLALSWHVCNALHL
jgi:hypothetical protein